MRVPFSFIKSGAFNPLSVAGARVWYDLAHQTHSGGIVTALPDMSGNGCNAVIPVGNEPFFTAANASFNNLPTMDHSPAVDQRYVDSGDIAIAAGAPFTYVLVAKGTGDYFMSARSTNGSIYQPGTIRMTGDSGTTNLSDGVTTGAAASVFVAVFNGVSSKLYVNAKTPIATGNAGAQSLGATPNRVVRLGMYGAGVASIWSQVGSTAHALVYDGALSGADVAYLLTGFGALAGIPIGP